MNTKRFFILGLVLLAVLACSPKETLLPSEDVPAIEDPVSRENPEENPGDDNTGENTGENTDENTGENSGENTGENQEDPQGQEIVLSDEDYIQTGMPTPAEEGERIRFSTDEASIRDAYTGQAFRLLKKLYRDKSVVLSPLSLQLALSVLANGADGAALEELLDFLGTTDLQTLNDFNHILTDQLPAVDLSVAVKVANALIVSDAIGVQPSFKDRIERAYYAAVESMDFSRFDYVKAVVNEWCNRNTEGLIPILLDDNAEPSDAYLLNALYFKAAWTSPIPDYIQEADHPFYTADGTIQVDYFGTREHLRYLDTDIFQMVSLPLGDHGLYQMTFLLPKEGTDASVILPEMTSAAWTDWLSGAERTDVSLTLPKYRTASTLSLKESLSSLGLQTVFDPFADYSKMFDSPDAMAVTEATQKAVFSLDEGGVEAAAVTEIGFAGSSGEEEPEPVYIHLNHPFVYVLSEKSSGIILFMGIYDGR